MEEHINFDDTNITDDPDKLVPVPRGTRWVETFEYIHKHLNMSVLLMCCGRSSGAFLPLLL